MEDPAIIRLNIERYRGLLKLELSEHQRQTMTRLLAECERQLAEPAPREEDRPHLA